MSVFPFVFIHACSLYSKTVHSYFWNFMQYFWAMNETKVEKSKNLEKYFLKIGKKWAQQNDPIFSLDLFDFWMYIKSCEYLKTFRWKLSLCRKFFLAKDARKNSSHKNNLNDCSLDLFYIKLMDHHCSNLLCFGFYPKLEQIEWNWAQKYFFSISVRSFSLDFSDIMHGIREPKNGFIRTFLTVNAVKFGKNCAELAFLSFESKQPHSPNIHHCIVIILTFMSPWAMYPVWVLNPTKYLWWFDPSTSDLILTFETKNHPTPICATQMPYCLKYSSYITYCLKYRSFQLLASIVVTLSLILKARKVFLKHSLILNLSWCHLIHYPEIGMVVECGCIC